MAYSPAHLPASSASPAVGSLLLLLPAVLAFALYFIVASRRRGQQGGGRGGLSYLGKGLGAGTEIRVSSATRRGYGTNWNALGVLITRSSLHIIHLVKASTSENIWLALEDPGTPILLTDEDFITMIDGIPTAVLVALFGTYRSITHRDVVNATLFKSPAVACWRVYESDGGMVPVNLDPGTALSEVLTRVSNPNKSDPQVTCISFPSLREALHASPSGVAAVTVNGTHVFMPVSINELVAEELDHGTTRYINGIVTQGYTFYENMLAYLKGRIQQTMASNMKILFIGVSVAMIIALLLMVLRHI